MREGKSGRKWTYADYCTWTDNQRCELIDGERFDVIAPTPSDRHQEILGLLATQFANFLHGKKCKVRVAPYDVRLPDRADQDSNETTSVVQPDLVVICDYAKLDEAGCKGAPDLAVEIITPGMARHDTITKFKLYERVGVKEYWLVQPVEKTVTVFKINAAGMYGRPDMYDSAGQIAIPLFGDFTVNLQEVFVEDNIECNTVL